MVLNRRTLGKPTFLTINIYSTGTDYILYISQILYCNIIATVNYSHMIKAHNDRIILYLHSVLIIPPFILENRRDGEMRLA